MQHQPAIWRRCAIPLIIGLLCLAPSAFAQLSGSYTIGSGGNYTSFTDAVTALTTSGVSGPVTFSVLSGTYNEQITIPAITGASATNTITFDGGTGNAATRVLTYTATTAYSPTVTLNGADYIIIKNLTIRAASPTYGQGVLFTNSADYNEISNCVIEVSPTTTDNEVVGILACTTTSYSTTGDYGNYNLIKDNTITGGYYGIRWNGSATTDYTTAVGNQFTGNTLTEWYYYGMYLYYIGGSLVVSHNNAVQRTSGTSITTSSGYAYYIYYPNDGPVISYNYGWARVSPFYIYRTNYAQASTSNRAKVYNNMGVADGTGTVYGLYVSYARYTDVVYNSVQARNTTGTGYGIYTYGESTAYDTKFLNNMVSHDGTGTFYWIYNYYSASISAFDYNVFYKTGIPSTEYCRWNNVDYTTLTACKAAVTAFNQHSVIGNPRWASSTDVHSTSMVAYQTGIPVSGYTDDYDGDTRSSTVPCIGADEYTLSNMAFGSVTTTQNNTAVASAGLPDQEVIGVEIAVTGSLSPLSATSFTFNTSGTTDVTDISAARLYYTGSSPVFATTTLVGSYSTPNGSFTINGSQALDGPGTNYFWLTYDIVSSATAGDFIDAQCNSVTVAGTAYVPTVTDPTGNRMILAPLNGVYTINALGSGNRNFTTFQSAVDRMVLLGVSGPVTFNVAAGTYFEQVIIPPIAGASATNTITFDGGTGNAATRILEYDTPSQYSMTLLLDGADYFTFKNLTVRSTGVTYGYAVQFAPGGDALGSNNNSFLNCVIQTSTNATGTEHIALLASGIGSYTSYGNNANNTLIKDCDIKGGYYAVRWNGSSSTTYDNNVGNQFVSNVFSEWYYYGLYMYYQGTGLVATRNTSIQRQTGSITTTSGYGIYGAYLNDGPVISYNYARAAYAPFYITYLNNAYASTSNRGKVFNNMSVAIGTSTVYAFYASYPRFSDVVFNSAYAKTTGTCYGLYFYGQSTAGYDHKYANNYVVFEGNGTFYPLYNYYAISMGYCDYNAFYRIGTGTDNWYWNYTATSAYPTLAAMQAASPASIRTANGATPTT